MPGQECSGCGAVYAIGAPACPECGCMDAVEEGARPAGLPAVTYECRMLGCRYVDVPRRVPLTQVVPGLLAVPMVVCAGCGAPPILTRGWPVTAGEDDQDMPKITTHGGPSNDNPPDLGTPVVADDAGAGAVPEPAPAPGPDPGSGGSPDSPARPPLPSARAPRPDWEAWCIGAGLPEDDAKAMSKAKLQEWATARASADTGDGATVVAQDRAEAEVTPGGGGGEGEQG